MLLVVFVLSAAALAQVQIYDIGMPANGAFTHGNAVNNAGEVTGWAHLTNVSEWAQERNFIWSPTGGLNMIYSWAPNTVAGNINASGVVPGSYYDGSWNFRTGTYTVASGWSDIPASNPSAGFNHFSYGINDGGTVVGQAASGGGFIYNPGTDTITDIGKFPGNSATTAKSINSNGVIIGTGTQSNGGPMALSYVNNQWNDLGSLGGWWSAAFAVNNNNVMVGIGSLSNGYAKGMMRDLDGGSVQTVFDMAGYNYGIAYGINNLDVVVGAVSNTNYWEVGGWSYITGMKMDGRAVIWDSVNGNRFLDELLPAGSGWTLLAATGISDNGNITGWGEINGEIHGFMMTVPEPMSVLLLGIGGLFTCVRKRSR